MDYFNSMEYKCLRTIDQLMYWRFFEINKTKAIKIRKAIDHMESCQASKKKSMTPYYIYTGIVFIFAMVVLVSMR